MRKRWTNRYNKKLGRDQDIDSISTSSGGPQGRGDKQVSETEDGTNIQ